MVPRDSIIRLPFGSLTNLLEGICSFHRGLGFFRITYEDTGEEGIQMSIYPKRI